MRLHLPKVEFRSCAELSESSVRWLRRLDGVVLRIDSIRPMEPGLVEVDTVIEAGCSSGQSYRLQRVDGRWSVVSQAMWWID